MTNEESIEWIYPILIIMLGIGEYFSTKPGAICCIVGLVLLIFKIGGKYL